MHEECGRSRTGSACLVHQHGRQDLDHGFCGGTTVSNDRGSRPVTCYSQKGARAAAVPKNDRLPRLLRRLEWIYSKIPGGQYHAGKRNRGTLPTLRPRAEHLPAPRCGDGIQSQRSQAGKYPFRWNPRLADRLEAAFLSDRYTDLAVAANFVVTNDAEEDVYLRTYFGEAVS